MPLRAEQADQKYPIPCPRDALRDGSFPKRKARTVIAARIVGNHLTSAPLAH
jgi:hypothetical protein